MKRRPYSPLYVLLFALLSLDTMIWISQSGTIQAQEQLSPTPTVQIETETFTADSPPGHALYSGESYMFEYPEGWTVTAPTPSNPFQIIHNTGYSGPYPGSSEMFAMFSRQENPIAIAIIPTNQVGIANSSMDTTNGEESYLGNKYIHQLPAVSEQIDGGVELAVVEIWIAELEGNKFSEQGWRVTLVTKPEFLDQNISITREIIETLSYTTRVVGASVHPPSGESLPIENGGNLLRNPDFELPHGYGMTLTAPPEWTVWTDTPNRLVGRQLRKGQEPALDIGVYRGNGSFDAYVGWRPYRVLLYQTVHGIPPGFTVHLSAYGRIWSCDSDAALANDSCIGDDGSVGDQLNTGAVFRVGIDPEGASDPNSPAIVWSSPTNPYTGFQPMIVDGTTNSGSVTVVLDASMQIPVRHQHVFWDAASLAIVEGSESPPPSSLPEPSQTPSSPNEHSGQEPTMIASETLRVRSEPSINSPQIGTLYSGAARVVIGRNTTGRWLQISHEGLPGWVCREFASENELVSQVAVTDGSGEDCFGNSLLVEVTPNSAPVADSGTCPETLSGIVTAGVHGRIASSNEIPTELRARPTTDGVVLAAMRPGIEFDVVGGPLCVDGLNWWLLRLADRTIGWIKEDPTSHVLQPVSEASVNVSLTPASDIAGNWDAFDANHPDYDGWMGRISFYPDGRVVISPPAPSRLEGTYRFRGLNQIEYEVTMVGEFDSAENPSYVQAVPVLVYDETVAIIDNVLFLMNEDGYVIHYRSNSECGAASNCSVTCVDGSELQDTCPANGAFSSCQVWDEEACREHGGTALPLDVIQIETRYTNNMVSGDVSGLTASDVILEITNKRGFWVNLTVTPVGRGLVLGSCSG